MTQNPSSLNYDSAWAIVGGLSTPSKLPGYSWSISASRCKIGSKLHKVAGSVCHGCYARRGNYLFPVVRNAHAIRLRAIRHKDFVPAMIYLMQCLDQKYFRWMDSGDIQNERMLIKIIEIARGCPGTKFWLPTKEYSIVSNYIKANGPGAIPHNLNIRLSGYMVNENGPIALGDKLNVTISEVRSNDEAVTCPSHKQGNKCATCRACWDKSVFCVVYRKH